MESLSSISKRKLSYFIFTSLVLYVLIFQSPYRLDQRNIDRFVKCGFSTFMSDLRPTPFVSMSPVSYSNMTLDELMKREQSLIEKKSKYQFGKVDLENYPPSLSDFDSLRCEQDFTLPDYFAFFGNLRKVIMEMAITEKIGNLYSNLSIFDTIFLSPFISRPLIADHWKEDSTFSKQRLSGVNPAVIKRIYEIPTKLAIDQNRIGKYLNRNFEEELAKGRFYIEDYEILDNIPVNTGSMIFPTICLHYLLDNGTLVPVAIQLYQDINRPENNLLGVFYADEENQQAWLFAKVCVQLATAIHHQVLTHLLNTHLVIEVWIVSFHRNLPDDHPVHAILKNHMRKTIAINHQARVLLLPKIIDLITSPGVPGAKIITARSYGQKHFKQSFLKNDLIRRGVWEPDVPKANQSLPNYDYRDFAIPVWDTISVYAEGIIDVFYPDDLAVLNDAPLQAWAKCIAQDGNMKGFPTPIISKKELAETITMMIFTSTAQHSAINFNQYDILGYTPNMPLSLNLDRLPHQKSDITEELVINALPGFKKSALQTASVWVLSSLPVFGEEEMLIHPIQWEHPSAQNVANQFIKNLHQISADVAKINSQRSQFDQYYVLDPVRIPAFTSI